jgi:hypothetical protein
MFRIPHCFYAKAETRSLKFTECSCSSYHALKHTNATITSGEDNIKVELKETECNNVLLIILVGDRVK